MKVAINVQHAVSADVAELPDVTSKDTLRSAAVSITRINNARQCATLHLSINWRNQNVTRNKPHWSSACTLAVN